MSVDWLIVGCGYVGTRLAAQLVAEGKRVVATCRTKERCAAVSHRVPELQMHRFDLASVESLPGLLPKATTVVLSAPPGAGSPKGEAFLARTQAQANRFIYLSTTGVYGPCSGEEVDETSPVAPNTKRARARVEVESALRKEDAPSVVLRCPGIYGPFRGVHRRLAHGDFALVRDAPYGESVVSRVHVDDLVSAIRVVAEAPHLPGQVFNVADDCPTTSEECAVGIAREFGFPMPNVVPANQLSPTALSMRSGNRRIVSRRLQKLGWRPAYVSWREGVAQALQEERDPKSISANHSRAVHPKISTDS